MQLLRLAVLDGATLECTISLPEDVSDGATPSTTTAPGTTTAAAASSEATQPTQPAAAASGGCSVPELLARPRLHVAPMIDVTNRHFRMLIRCISPLPVLWTEMTWDRAILYNTPDQPEHKLKKTELDRTLESIIGFSDEERPLVMQLGGSDPEMLARSARLAEQRGYDEINLNCGCPAQTRGRSRNNYGARLMYEPALVARCCAAMVAAVSIPVTVKCRLGVDDHDSYAELREFVTLVSAEGVRHFIVHARKAILGLDTVKNRSVPPLRHEWVYRLVADFPHVAFSINGGIKSIEEARELLARGAHGVMLGRRARDEPYLFARAGELYDGRSGPTRREVLARYSAYAAAAQPANWEMRTPAQDARALLTPLSGLFHGTRSCKRWQQTLCALMQEKEALATTPAAELIALALARAAVLDAVLDARPDDAPLSNAELRRLDEQQQERQQQEQQQMQETQGKQKQGGSRRAAAAGAAADADADEADDVCPGRECPGEPSPAPTELLAGSGLWMATAATAAAAAAAVLVLLAPRLVGGVSAAGRTLGR